MRILSTSKQPAGKKEPVKDFSVIPGDASGSGQGRAGSRKNRGKTKYDFDDVEMDPSEPYVNWADKTWHMNLRTKDVHKPSNGWRRHFTRPFQSFDHLKSNLADAATAEAYKTSESTPRACKWLPDRQKGPWGGIFLRDDEVNFTRSKGCEGAQAGLWLHLYNARQERSHLAHATCLREAKGDTHGARVTDNRNDGCIIEMLGKKTWSRATRKSADLKLQQLHYLKPGLYPDEENRLLRVSKTPRTDAARCGPEYAVSKQASREASREA